MEAEIPVSVQELATRVRAMMLNYERLRAENEEMRRSLEASRLTIEEDKALIKQLKSQISSQRLAQSIALGDAEIKQAEARLNRMIREVDKCIALMG